MEIRFDDLNGDRIKVSVDINDDYRHGIDGDNFMKALLNLSGALTHYVDNLMAKMLIGKMMGVKPSEN